MNNTCKILILVSLIVLLILVGTIVYFCFNKENFLGRKFRGSDHWKKYIKNIKNIKYLEIGSHSGNSVINFNNIFCKNNTCELHCIDPCEDYDEYSEYKNTISKTYNDFIKNTNDENINNLFVHRGFSNIEIPKLKDNYFDIIFIDGNHNPEFIIEDAVLSFRKLKKNGILIFDDVGWGPKNNKTDLGINAFKMSYKNKIEILSNNDQGQCFIRKVS